MANVNFILKEPNKKNAETLIYLFYRYKGNKVKFSTGKKINSGDWSFEKQKAKQIMQQQKTGNLN